MNRRFLMLLLLFISSRAAALEVQVLDQLVWDYGQFVETFRAKNWDGVCGFVTEHTKAGFGGEEGCAGVRQVYAEDARCWEEMVFALRQGCKRTGSGDHVVCIAPPQFSDPAVSYLGARAGFSYDRERARWVADFLICGGD